MKRLVLILFLLGYCAGCVDLGPERARLEKLEERQALEKQVVLKELESITALEKSVDALEHNEAVRSLHGRQ